MGDESESRTEASEAPRTKAEDNPWYLLATLYGVPEPPDYELVEVLQGVPIDELREKNRVAWNRYFAVNLNDETRARFIREQRHSVEELTPLSPEELREVEQDFGKRRQSAIILVLPPPNSLINFSDVEFDHFVCFDQYLFTRVAFFTSAVFPDGGNSFRDATFCGGALFDRAIFAGSAWFGGASFLGGASFGEVSFSSGASFDRAIFSGLAEFVDATFSGEATFSGANFSGNAVFCGVTFSGGAQFDCTTFSTRAWFDRARFYTNTSFVNAEMKNETLFEDAEFKTNPPRFFGAKLHQGTVWRGIKWPPLRNDRGAAGTFIDAYSCLKLEMDRLKKHEDELKFFALELQSLRILRESKFRGAGLPIAIYGIVCDYGRSYIRPLIGLFMVAAIGALLILRFGSLSPWQSLGFSFANTFNVFGFRKDYFDAATIGNLPDLLKVLSAIQTILGTILLFLVGLGVRNRFRMK